MIPNKEKMDNANRWLNKAIELETEGKMGFSNKSIERACELERQAFSEEAPVAKAA